MGGFLAVSAFQVDDPEAVLASAERFFAGRECAASRIGAAWPGDEDLQVYAPAGGWTVAFWPNRFTSAPAARAISAELGCLAVDVDVFDGDYWTHTLLRDGEVLDVFSSDPEEAEVSPGAPDVIAAAMGVPVDWVQPYLVVVDDDESPGRAFADDQFEVDDPWVFADLWRRLGVHYPDDLAAGAGGLRLSGEWRLRPSG
jgi:hypothetical protein